MNLLLHYHALTDVSPRESPFLGSSESTIVSAVELLIVWKAMELLQLDEKRMLRVKLSLQEVLPNGHLQPGE
jgi:hypothetical protein